MSYNTAAIRELLQVVFNDEELTSFCFDHFRSVYKQFASEIGYLLKIHLLIESCDKHKEFDKLLTLIKEINPKQYDKLSPTIKDPPKTPTVGSGIRKVQIEITLSGEFSNFTPELRSAAVGALAGVLDILRDQITVLQVQAGSIILQVEMPREAVNRLMALYKIGDPIIQALGVQQVKIIEGKSRRAVKVVEINIPSELGYEKISIAAAAIVAERMGFSLDRIEGLKTAVGEAVTNAIEHGNQSKSEAKVLIKLTIHEKSLVLDIIDQGLQPIPDIPTERQERDDYRGWGMIWLQDFMDEVEVVAKPGRNELRMAIYLES